MKKITNLSCLNNGTILLHIVYRKINMKMIMDNRDQRVFKTDESYAHLILHRFKIVALIYIHG
jgi:hypothetical protein